MDNKIYKYCPECKTSTAHRIFPVGVFCESCGRQEYERKPKPAFTFRAFVLLVTIIIVIIAGLISIFLI